MSDWYLTAIITGIVCVDVVILIAWEAMDPLDQKEVDVYKPRVMSIITWVDERVRIEWHKE